MTAFDWPATREVLLARLDGPDAPAIDEQGLPSPQAIEAFASSTGLNRTFLHLAATMVDGQPDFLRTLVATIPIEADLLAVVRRWILRVYEKVAPLIDAPAERKAALTVAQLHDRALSGDQVLAADWRRARMTFPALDDGAGGCAAGVMAAAAWDLEGTPGAAGDVVVAWRRLALGEADAEIAWRPEEDALLLKYNQAAYDYVREAVGSSDDQNDPEWQEKCVAAHSKFRREHPTDLLRSAEIKERHLAAMRRLAREKLFAELSREAELRRNA